MSLRVLTDVAIAMTATTSMAASVYRAARQFQAALSAGQLINAFSARVIS